MRFAITDAADPRLADYVRLRDASLRRHLESERGLFIAEGGRSSAAPSTPDTGRGRSCWLSAGWRVCATCSPAGQPYPSMS